MILTEPAAIIAELAQRERTGRTTVAVSESACKLMAADGLLGFDARGNYRPTPKGMALLDNADDKLGQP